MAEKSLVNVAYQILSEDYNSGKQEPKKFLELCSEICDRLGMTEEEFMKVVSRFYTDLTLDGRFVIKENNTWFLREHELYKNVHIDMNKVYDLEDETDEDGKKDDDAEDSDSFEEKEEDNYEDGDTIESGTDDDSDDENN